MYEVETLKKKSWKVPFSLTLFLFGQEIEFIKTELIAVMTGVSNDLATEGSSRAYF